MLGALDSKAPQTYKLLDSLHPWSQDCDSGAELKVVFGKGGLLRPRTKFCIPVIAVG